MHPGEQEVRPLAAQISSEVWRIGGELSEALGGRNFEYIKAGLTAGIKHYVETQLPQKQWAEAMRAAESAVADYMESIRN